MPEKEYQPFAHMTKENIRKQKQEALETQKEIEKKRKQIREDISEVLKIKQGRRVFWFLINDICKVTEAAVDIDNIYNTYFQNGKKKVGEVLLEKIKEIEPMFLFKMARENLKNKK
jgi:hypothetical protein